MSHASEAHQDITKEVNNYLFVFGCLAFLTVVTVLVSRLHLGLAGNITVALIIATFKASLVACYFMHLISERKLIYSILILTAIFLIGLIVLLLGGYHDPIMGTKIVP